MGVVLLSLWASPIRADATTPASAAGEPAPPAPVCKRAEWKRIGRAVSRYCAQHREDTRDCPAYAQAFRDCDFGEGLDWKWIGNGWQIAYEAWNDGVLFLTVTRERGGWKVTSLTGKTTLPTPFPLEPR